MATLLISIGSNSIPHEVTDEITAIGRSPDNAIQIDDPSVSGRHAQLHRVGETFHLQDLDSTNGTRVNGEAITSAALKVGDRIRFGKVDACFECEVAAENSSPAPLLSSAEVRPAEVSTRPADFENASPFPRRQTDKDSVRLAIFAFALIALLAFIASMLALAQMRPPVL